MPEYNRKDRIADTLMALVRQYGLDRVTVRQLVEACGISRQTFYYHFQDLMEALEWAVERRTRQVLERCREAETPMEALCLFTAELDASRPMVHRLLRSRRREQVERLLMRTARTYLEEAVRRAPPEAQPPKEDLEVLLDYHACGMAGLLLSSERRRDPQRLAGQLMRLLSGSLSPGGLAEHSRKTVHGNDKKNGV